MSSTFERPPDEPTAANIALRLSPGGLESSPADADPLALTLGALPLGAHLVLRCRKDWRTATVVRIEPEKITLSVSSPTGRTYRMHRPPASPLTFDGHVPLLGEGAWRACLASYDPRW